MIHRIVTMELLVGSVVVSKGPADGHTLLMGATGPISINPATYRNLSYAPQKDFVPISLVASFPLVVSTNAIRR